MTPEELEALIAQETADFEAIQSRGSKSSPTEGKEKGSTWRSMLVESLPLDPTRAITKASQGYDDLMPEMLGGTGGNGPSARTKMLEGIRQGFYAGGADEIDAAYSQLGGTGEETFGETVQVESDARDKNFGGIAGFLGEMLGGVYGGTKLAQGAMALGKKALGADVVRKGFNTAWGRFAAAAGGASAEATLNSSLEGGLYTGVVENKWGPLIQAAGLGAAGGVGAQAILGEVGPRLLRAFDSKGTNRVTMVKTAQEINSYLRGQNVKIDPKLMDPEDMAARAANLPPDAKMLDVYPELEGLIRDRTSRLTPREQLQPLVDHVLKRAQFADETFVETLDEVIARPELRSKATVERDVSEALRELQPKYNEAFDEMLDAGVMFEGDDVTGAISDTFRLVDSATGKEKNVLNSTSNLAFRELQEYVADLGKKSNGSITPRQLNAVKHEIDKMLTEKRIKGPTNDRASSVIDRDTARLLVDARIKIKTMLHATAPDSLKQLDKMYGDELATNRAYNAGAQTLKDRSKDVDDYDIFLSDPTTTPAEGAAFMEGLKKAIADMADTSTTPAAIKRKITENPMVLRKVSALLGPEKAQKLIGAAEQYALSTAQAKRAIGAMPVPDVSNKGFIANLVDMGMMGGMVTGATGTSLGLGALRRSAMRGELPVVAGEAKALNDLMMQPGGAPSTIGVLNKLMQEGLTPMHQANTAAAVGVGSQLGE